MSSAEDNGSQPSGFPPEVRIGTPERRAAEVALQVHLRDKRLDPDEFERRLVACERASNQTELLWIFVDLPAPHPELSSTSVAPAETDEDIPPGALAGCLTLGLGLPVAVVLGFVYGTWWALAVPVAVTVVMAYVEHLRQPARRPVENGDPPPAD